MDKIHHWADQVAERIIRQVGEKEIYTLASGITPSGTVHIGNFRELITVDFVKRALEKAGKKVRFVFSWDDYDVFRKIPKNMPKQDLLKKYLGKPIVLTPDPFEKESSYARHHEVNVEKSINKVGIFPEFIYQAEKYQKGDYAKEIITAIEKKEVIKEILNEYRKEPLSENWLPVSVFCGKCHANKMKEITYKSHGKLFYQCEECGHEELSDLEKTGIVKLLWRIDWPMRWSVEDVDFEPGGKDHSSEGGSFDTAKKIVSQVYGHRPPIYQMYDFVRIKGKGGKISSSSGEVITLDDVLEIYEPEIVRWIFSSYKTNVEFAISFDLDVIKIYEDYDRVERKYFGLEEVSQKQKGQINRAYELAQIKNTPKAFPFQASFRHLSNIIQINDFDKKKTIFFYQHLIKQDHDKNKLDSRIDCAINWLTKYAPEEFKFSINKEKINLKTYNPPTEYLAVIKHLKNLLSQKLTEAETNQQFYDFIKAGELELAEAFKWVYFCLISQSKGPKLIPFIYNIGIKRVISLLDF